MRKLNYCTEVLIIKTGKVKIIFYDDKGKNIKKPFEYSSENNVNFLSVKDIKNLIKNL